MNVEAATPVHRSFRVIGAVALIWNVLGCVNFIVQLNPGTHAAYREVERAIIEGRPAWATAGFAVAVFGGAIGSVLLLLRKSSAFNFFIASLLGVFITIRHAVTVDAEFGTGEIMGIVVMPLAVAIFLVWYSKLAARKRWIR